MNPELWRTQPVLALASLAPVPLGALWMAIAPQLPFLKSHRVALAWFTWFATRVVFGALLWGALGHSGIDQLAFFLPQAKQALAGGLPYRDFASAYGPLFAPLLGVAVRVLGDAGPFVLFVLADFITWRALVVGDEEEGEAPWAWAALPMVWYFTVRYAQDEALGAMFVALAWGALRCRRPAFAGLALGLGLVATKPLFALLVLPFAFASPHRRVVLGFAAAPAVAVYGGLLALGAPIAQPLALEGGNFGVGPTLWRVPVVLAGFDLGLAGWLPFALVTLAGTIVLARRHASIPDHAAWQYGAFAALAPKFMPMYSVLWAPLLAAWAAGDPDRRGWLLVYGSVLPLAWYLDSGPLQGLFGLGWQAVAIAGLVGVAALAMWPMRVMLPRASDR